jgi:hypothetical protein
MTITPVPPIDVDLLRGEIRKTSTFEDTRRKAMKFGANGATVGAYKP